VQRECTHAARLLSFPIVTQHADPVARDLIEPRDPAISDGQPEIESFLVIGEKKPGSLALGKRRLTLSRVRDNSGRRHQDPSRLSSSQDSKSKSESDDHV